MPLAKKTMKSKKNQGAQWGDTGSAGNIKHSPSSMDANIAGPREAAKNNRHGRDKSIGRGRSETRAPVNPE